MPLFALNKELYFPPVHLAEPDGLLAMGGDLSTERLLLAYRSGIFPWYEGRTILWWSPDPRFVLFPSSLKVSKSMQQLIRRNTFDFTINQAFDQVIAYCRHSNRKGQFGTWITDDVEKAYNRLHSQGYAHSAEAWLNGKLVGGTIWNQNGQIFLWRKHVQPCIQCQQIRLYPLHAVAAFGRRRTDRLPGVYTAP